MRLFPFRRNTEVRKSRRRQGDNNVRFSPRVSRIDLPPVSAALFLGLKEGERQALQFGIYPLRASLPD